VRSDGSILFPSAPISVENEILHLFLFGCDVVQGKLISARGRPYARLDSQQNCWVSKSSVLFFSLCVHVGQEGQVISPSGEIAAATKT